VTSDSDSWARATEAHRAGRLEEAAAGYGQMLRRNPTHAPALHQLGLLHYQRGDAAQALALLEAALEVTPDADQVLSNTAVVLRSLGRHAEALGLLDRAIALKPDLATAHGNRGLALQAIGRHAEALESFDRALATGPGTADLLRHRADALYALQRHDEAAAAYRRALELQPAWAEVHWCLGNTLLRLDRPEAALASFDRAITLKPDYAEAFLNRGSALDTLRRHEQALASFERALAIKPDFPEALSNRCNALLELARYDEAVASSDQALALRPDYAQAHWNRSLIRLLQGELAEGFGEYEWRWKRPEIASSARRFEQPLWGGEPLRGRTILLHAEQGIGDTLQFVRYVPLVAARGARIVLEVQRPLQRLLSVLPGVSQVIAEGDDLPAFDVHCPLLSLPRAFGTTLETIPAEAPYLPLRPAAVATWKERLPAPGPRIGIAWSGNPAHKSDWKRSIPFACLTPLLAQPGLQFISLQYGVREADRAAVEASHSLVHLPTGWEEFAETAAVISHLDLVITVDTAVAHLAGALACPVWILLATVPDWRWLLARGDSPWYPTARLFRRQGGESWEDVIRRVAEALPARFAGQPSPPAPIAST
jgi:tetratricopeptide (TPR) repeat protein